MKSTLEFNLPEERGELEAVIQGPYLKSLIDDEIWNVVFRPGIRYQSYSRAGAAGVKLNEILDSKDQDLAVEVIELLGQIFHDLISET